MNARLRRVLRRVVLLSTGLPLLPLAFSLGAGCGGNDAGTRLAAPAMVAATGGDAHITVTWAPVENAARYLVYSASVPGVTPGDDALPDYRRDQVAGDQTEFVLDVANGQTRWFVVTTVNSKSREGGHSSEVFAVSSPWEIPDPVEILSGDALSPRIASDPVGGMYAIWTRNQTTWATHLARRSGGSWEIAPRAVVTSAGTLASGPRVAAGGGTAVYVWQVGTGVSNEIYAARWDGIQFTTAARIDDLAGGARNPEIAIDAAGDALAVWVQTNGAEQDIRGASLTAGAWSAPQSIDAGAEPADEARVASDAAGNGLAVWVQDGALVASRWTGAWGSPVMVTTTSARVSSPSITMHPQTGDGVAVWLQTDAQNDTDVWAAQFDIGTGWAAPERVESHPLAASQPSAALHASGRAIATWLQRSGTREVVATARYLPAGGWSAAVFHDAVAEANAGASADPTIRFLTDDEAVASWSQQVSGFGTGAYENVYALRVGVTDTTISRAVLLVSRFGLNTEPQLVVDSSGGQTAIWTRYGPAGNEIWFNQR